MGGHPGTKPDLVSVARLLDIAPVTMDTCKEVASSLGDRVDASGILNVERYVEELSEELFDTFEEECTVYSVVPDIYRDICRWIVLSALASKELRVPSGRKDLRKSICDYISDPSKGAELPPSAASAVPTSRTSPQVVIKSEGCHVNAIQHAKTVTHAVQTFKSSGYMVFDGVHNPERYILFKYDISELIKGCGYGSDQLLAMEVLMASLRGIPLANLRRCIGERDLYATPDVRVLWQTLDSLYLNPEAARYVTECFIGCKQGQSESLAAYAGRFKRLAEVKRSLGAQLSELELITQFSCGLTSHLGTFARGICDPMAISSLDQYSIQLITVSRSLEPLLQTNAIANNAMNPKFSCHRCGDPTHKIANCKRRVKYGCKYCQSFDHFASVCPQQHSKSPGQHKLNSEKKENRSMANNLHAVAEDSEDSVGNNLARIATTNSVAKVSMNSMTTKDHLVDPDEPLGMLEIEGRSLTHEKCLYDTGAGANFVHADLAKCLIKKGCIKKSGIVDMPNPIKVTYGNSDFEYADCYVTMKVRKARSDCWSEILCLVTKSCSYPFILGRTGLKQLSLMNNTFVETSLSCPTVAVTHIAPEGDVVVFDPCRVPSGEKDHPNSLQDERVPLVRVTEDQRLMIQFGLLENAHVLPYRAPRRNRSFIDMQIIKAKLDQMVAEGKVELCESRECHMLHEIVLVDKKVDEKLPRVYPDNLKRYRVTLDLRVGNDLELVDIGDANALVPNKFATKVKTTKTLYDHQYQTGAIEILRGLPAGAAVYAKIDLDDAFQSVLLPSSLRSLFCCVCQTASGPMYYRWNSLPQGWKWSPLFFQIAVQLVLDQVRIELDSSVEVRHYQDDILVQGPTEEIVARANVTICQKFLHFGFRVNASKCSMGNSTIFCGYHLSQAGIKPAPKEPITERFVTESWAKFETASFEERLTLLRGWSGKFNYFVGFLPPQQLASLRVLYSASGKKNAADNPFDLPGLFAAFSDLCRFVLDGHIGTFPIGRIPDVICSIVVTDANASSYCGILFRLCPVDESKFKQLTIFRDLVKLICQELGLDTDVDRLMAIPIRICGGTFTPGEQKQSSTYRERLCQLRCVDQFYNLITGHCVVVSDNQNVGRTWHNLDETLSYGSNLVPWQRFISIVHTALWIPREDPLMSLVDYAARLLDQSYMSIPKAQVKLQTASAEPPQPVAVEGSTHVSRRVSIPVLALPLRDAIIDSYINDNSTYLNVPMVTIYNHIVHGTRADPKASKLSARFTYQDGLLLHIRQPGSVQIYIPSGGSVAVHSDVPCTIRAAILFHFHDAITGLHRGYNHLVSTISTLVWWPTILADSLTYVKTCKRCQQIKMRFTPFQGELRTIQASQPVQNWIVDYAGPMSRGENKFVLVAMCAFSSFALLIPTDSSTAENTANLILERIVSNFGIPESIYSDRGTQFNSDVIKKFNDLLGIKWRLSSSYSPRTQGLAERMIQQMKKNLECMNYQSNCLPMIQLLHNSSLIGSMPLSPFEVVYGFRPNISPLINTTDISEDTDRTELLYDIRREWTTFKSLMRDRTSDIYQSRSNVHDFKIGDSVMRVYVTEKYGPDRIKSSGPHILLERSSVNQFKISGYTYPIPEYQLHPVQERPTELEATPPVETNYTPLRSNLVPGVLILFEVFEDITISYDVAEVVSVEGDAVRAMRYWYTSDGKWKKWDNEFVVVDVTQVVSVGFELLDGRLPSSVTELFLS